MSHTELFITTSDNNFEQFKKDFWDYTNANTSAASCFGNIADTPNDDDLILRDKNGRRIRSRSPSPNRAYFLKR